MARLSDNHSAQHAAYEDALLIGLDEICSALNEALEGLTDAQVAAFPLETHHNIAWIVMHTLDNLQFYGSACLGGATPLAVDAALVSRPSYRHRDQTFPTAEALRAATRQVVAAVLTAAGRLQAGDLALPPAKPHKSKPTRADCVIRTTAHTQAHLRQIWLLRGLLNAGGWPKQHWS